MKTDAASRSWYLTRSHTTVETIELQGATRSEARDAFLRGEGERKTDEVHTDWVWTGGAHARARSSACSRDIAALRAVESIADLLE